MSSAGENALVRRENLKEWLEWFKLKKKNIATQIL